MVANLKILNTTIDNLSKKIDSNHHQRSNVNYHMNHYFNGSRFVMPHPNYGSSSTSIPSTVRNYKSLWTVQKSSSVLESWKSEWEPDEEKPCCRGKAEEQEAKWFRKEGKAGEP
ncbi:hypothetical protein GCK72_015733 [Caenorhabditis remanei]|uniref:Uncharacterized protein n=1 Tax=Caenorhabditis remanei TaxID=31234 RepID=A0A6A5GXF4_CAERE|nr:hypothetical protein GCK72_015733 [Caenorhabditis remanei]KAF1759269.1 hypothetical protein GCK72_015733 [Caenorhabditis remanei]